MDLVGTGSELEHDDSARFCWHKGLPPLEGIVICFLLQFIIRFSLAFDDRGSCYRRALHRQKWISRISGIRTFAFSLAIGRMEIFW